MQENEQDSRVTSDLEFYEQERDIAEPWRKRSKECVDFRFNKQWTNEEEEALDEIGHATVEVNYINPAVEQATALLTAKSPRFAVTGREDSDTQKGKVFGDLLSYLWYVSGGDLHYKQIVEDYFVKGLGYFYIYEDPNDDYGRGELKLTALCPWDVVVDHNAKDRLFRDANKIQVARHLTHSELLNALPKYKNKLKNAKPVSKGDPNSYNVPETELSDTKRVVFHPGDLGTTASEEDRYLLLETFEKIQQKYSRVLDVGTKKEIIYGESQYRTWLKKPAMALILPDGIHAIAEHINVHELEQGLNEKGVDHELKTVDNKALLDAGAYSVAHYFQQRIKKRVIAGEIVLYERVLPITDYPVIPFANKHTGSPFPVSDVMLSISLQELVNKMTSLAIAHTQATTNMKLLLPKGSVDDIEQVEKDWNRPNAVIPYDASIGEPHIPSPQPLSGAVIGLIEHGKHNIEYGFGIFESMMGQGDASPNTFRGTVAVDEFGQRRIRSKMRDLEQGLTQSGKVLIEWSQSFYTIEKMFKVIAPNGDASENKINEGKYDPISGELLESMNDITQGRYDVVVIAGSSLPTNRFAEYEVYRQAYLDKIIDHQEVLKKSEIFDKDGVLARMGQMNQMQAALQQAQEEIKKLEGDLQTATRESLHDRKKVELEKFGAKLDKLANKMELETRTRANDINASAKEVLLQTQKLIDESQDNGDIAKKPRKPRKSRSAPKNQGE